MDNIYSDYCYEVWRYGGNPDDVEPDDVPIDYDWGWDKPSKKYLPTESKDE